MKRFAYLTAESFEAAAKALHASDDSVAKAAGLDLIDLLKERIVEPEEVVNLLRIPSAPAAGEIPALTTLAEVERDERIRKEFPALAKAAGVAATPQVRNFATVGGNLCQHTRCWFFRNAAFECFKRGTGPCSALKEDAHNRYNAVFPTRKCGCAHPSNLAPALIALGARVACVHPEGGRTMDVELLYRDPKSGRLADTVLRRGEMIRAVKLEPSALTRNSTYLEFRERESFDYAVVSVAAAVDVQGGTVRDARIVLGAVAPTPYRARGAEERLRGKALSEETAKGAAETAMAEARPLSENAFKVPIAKTLIRRALQELGR